LFDCFDECRAFERSLPRLAPQIHSLFNMACFGVMASKQFRLALRDLCKLAFKRLGDAGVQCATTRSATFSLSASSTASVISSTNKGMPSVRSMMSSRTVAGRCLLPTTRSITASISRRQPIESDGSNVRSPDPGCLKLWPERHDQEDPLVQDTIHRPT